MRAFMCLCLISLLTLSSCHEEEAPVEIYQEGDLISGTEQYFQMGFYDAATMTPKVSPDGKFIVYKSIDEVAPQGLWVLDLATHQRLQLHPEGYVPDWSPDGKWVAFNIYPQVYIIRNNATGLKQLTFTGHNFWPDWSPNGLEIVFSNETSLSIMDTTGNVTAVLPETGFAGDWSSDGDKIVSSRVGAFLIYSLSKNKVDKVIESSLIEDHSEIKYSPDGTRVVFSNSEGIWIANPDGSSYKRIIPSHLYNPKFAGKLRLFASSPSWHPDGKHIVYQHFAITDYHKCQGSCTNTTDVQGYVGVYQVNVDSAIAASNLN